MPDVDDDSAWQKLAEEHYGFCEWVLTRAHRLPLTDGFARWFGYDSWDALLAASDPIVRYVDIDWYVTALPDGRWVAWDDSELSIDRVRYFSTREAAVQYHLDAARSAGIVEE